MSVEEALPWIKEHRNELLESIRNGKYKASPVRRVAIPKDNDGVRKLGIPTVSANVKWGIGKRMENGTYHIEYS